MNLKDLNEAIKFINEAGYYRLNIPNGIDINILEYSRKNKAWEYYFLDERGGKSGLRTFATEEEACEYALKDAIRSRRTFTTADIDAVERGYLGKPNPPERPLMSLDQIFTAIRLLRFYKKNYFEDPGLDDMVSSGYDKKKKKWDYSVWEPQMENGSIHYGEEKTFATEAEACEYVIRTAIETLCEFGDDWVKEVKNRPGLRNSNR